MPCQCLQSGGTHGGTKVAVCVGDQQVAAAAEPAVEQDAVDDVDVHLRLDLFVHDRFQLIGALLEVLRDKIDITCSRRVGDVMECTTIRLSCHPLRVGFICGALLRWQDLKGIGLVQNSI